MTEGSTPVRPLERLGLDEIFRSAPKRVVPPWFRGPLWSSGVVAGGNAQAVVISCTVGPVEVGRCSLPASDLVTFRREYGGMIRDEWLDQTVQ